MIALVQRVSQARVGIAGVVVGAIDAGLLMHLANDGPVTIPITLRD